MLKSRMNVQVKLGSECLLYDRFRTTNPTNMSALKIVQHHSQWQYSRGQAERKLSKYVLAAWWYKFSSLQIYPWSSAGPNFYSGLLRILDLPSCFKQTSNVKTALDIRCKIQMLALSSTRTARTPPVVLFFGHNMACTLQLQPTG